MNTYILFFNQETQKTEYRLAQTLEEGLNFFNSGDKKIALDYFGDVKVSTRFLCYDHSLGSLIIDDRKPILFETMIFGGKYNEWCERYHTYDEALEGHKRLCEMVDYISINRNKKIDELLK
jgi:hypothetical protein